MNLVSSDILISPIFDSVPKFDSVVFKGFPVEKLLRFDCRREDQTCMVLAKTVIRREDKIFWESCRDLLERSVKDAGFKVRGKYHFELLCFDVHREIKTYKYQELTQLIINHARKLNVGESRLIKYSSSYGLLKKIAEEDWGKIGFRTSVDIFNKEPRQWDLFVKKILKSTVELTSEENKNRPSVIVINDVSQQPVFDKDNKEQQQRLRVVLEKQRKVFEQFPEIYIRDQRGCIELL